MSVEENIDKFTARLMRRGTLTDNSALYAQQVKAKMKNVRFSLSTIAMIENTPLVTSQDAGTSITAMTQAILTPPEKNSILL